MAAAVLGAFDPGLGRFEAARGVCALQSGEARVGEVSGGVGKRWDRLGRGDEDGMKAGGMLGGWR